MKLSVDIRPITYLKTRTAELVNRTRRHRRPVIITQKGCAVVVVQDIESYERDRDTLLMLKLLAQGNEDVGRGHVVSQDALFDRLEKLVKNTRSSQS